MDLESGAHVPPELLDLIIEQLHDDFHTLLNLCLVSQSFCSNARRLLYRRIRVVIPTIYRLSRRDPQTMDIHGCTRFLTTVVNNPRLARYVREFRYAPQNGSRPAEFWELMNRALYYMINLKIFSFQNYVSTSKRNLFWGTKFQLEEFYWEDGYPVDRDGEMSWFLKSQPQLRVLSAPLGNLDNRIPLFPKLQTFIGDVDSIERLFCNHAVEKLRWKGNLSNQLVGWDRSTLNTALAKLRVLSIDVAWLPTLVPHLQSLEVLHITGSHSSREFGLTHKLSGLRILIWSPRSAYVQTYGQDEQGSIAKSCFGNTKHLEIIYFSLVNNHIGEKGFGCWARGEIAPMFRTCEELVKQESLHEFAPLLDTSGLNQFSMV